MATIGPRLIKNVSPELANVPPAGMDTWHEKKTQIVS